MAQVNPITLIFLILAFPAKFVRLAVKHDVALELETNQQLLSTYPNRKLPPDRLSDFEKNAWNRTKKIRSAIFGSVWSTGVAVILGLLTGYLIDRVAGKPSVAVLSSLQIVAAGIILVATLAFLGWEIQSFKGQTLPEKVNRWLFRTLYWLGTFLFVVSLGWSWLG